jgi:hypothetical protein
MSEELPLVITTGTFLSFIRTLPSAIKPWPLKSRDVRFSAEKSIIFATKFSFTLKSSKLHTVHNRRAVAALPSFLQAKRTKRTTHLHLLPRLGMRWDLSLFIFHGKLLRQKGNFNFTDIFIGKLSDKRTYCTQAYKKLLAQVTISKLQKQREIIISH